MIKMFIHNGSGNHGCEAIIRSTAKMFEDRVMLYSSDPDDDIRYGVENVVKLQADLPAEMEKWSLRWLQAALYHKQTGSDYFFNIYDHWSLLQSTSEGDICFSIGGDNYCYEGTDKLADINLALKKRGAKTVLWGCSIEGEVLKNPAIVADMKRYDLITARESITFDNLKRAGITENVILCSDPAFQLDRAEIALPNECKEGKTIGINVSPLVNKYGNMVMSNYVCLVEYILNETDFCVLLIPHVVWDYTDDRRPLKEIYNMFAETGRVFLVEDHNCMELKGLISQCRLFVGARTHATIAAYSTCVPTLVAGYSVKARGISRDIFGTEENYVVPVQSFESKDRLKDGFIWLLNHEVMIREHLRENMGEYGNRAFRAADAVKKLIRNE